MATARKYPSPTPLPCGASCDLCAAADHDRELEEALLKPRPGYDLARVLEDSAALARQEAVFGEQLPCY
jgi:hypothetical protein